MSRSSFPQRAVWPKLLPAFSSWVGIVGVVLSLISLILTGITDLNWWVKGILCLVAFALPIFLYAIWRYINILLQRVKQYSLLYNELEYAQWSDLQLQKNLMLFSQILVSAGIQMFEVTGLEWGNRSPLVVIACDQQVPIGSRLAVISTSTLNTLGQFEVVQPTFGGYLAREYRIVDAVWWGHLHNQVVRLPHPRIFDAVAILLVT